MDHGDDDFLADVTGFLDDYEAFQDAIRVEETTTDLLLDSNEVFAETEALFPPDSPTNSLRALLDDESTVQETLLSETLVGHGKSSKKPQISDRRLKYREKMKLERQMLQEEEKSLAEELRYLQHTRKKLKSIAHGDSPGSMWRSIAARQNEGRVVVEKQQQQLKNAVNGRASVIQEIAEMMREQCNRTASVEKAVQKPSLQVTADDAALFEEFLHDLDVLHARTDEMFRVSGVRDVSLTFCKKEPEIKRDGGMVYVDNVDVLPIPFSFEETCTVMWQSMVQVYRQRGRHHYCGVIDPENTIAVKLRLHPLGESGEPVDMMVMFVIRRYLEATRMILVWRALSDGEGECAGMHSDECGWCIVRPTDQDESSMMPTVMETFVRFIPMNIGKKSVNEVDAYQFTKLVVMSAEEDAGAIARMMDSLLIED